MLSKDKMINEISHLFRDNVVIGSIENNRINILKQKSIKDLF